MKTIEQKKEDAKLKRLNLSLLTKQLKKLADLGVMDAETANGLLREYYAKKGCQELHTFNEWKKLGYRVNKGVHAFLIWGRPRTAKASAEAGEGTGEEAVSSESGSYEFFPLAYLFDISQVTKVN